MATRWRHFKKPRSPSKTIVVIELIDVWRIDFIVPFMSSRRMKYLLVAVDYVYKWVEAIALTNNEGKSVTTFIKKYMLSFWYPKGND